MNRYLLVACLNTPQIVGPFPDAQSRNDFTSALWFGDPVKWPGEPRAKRISWFNRDQMYLYYFQVQHNVLTSLVNVTVGDLAQGKGGQRRLR